MGKNVDKTMLDILKERLVDGLEIINVIDGSREYRVKFSYGGFSEVGYLKKTCAPGDHNNTVDNVIFGTMAGLAIKRGDIEEARRWMDRLHNLAIGKE